jgi:hypothetical protein
VIGNDSLVAPFAYRPAVPLLAGAASRLFGISPGDAFQGIARASVVAFLFVSFMLARAFAGSAARGLLLVPFAAAALMPVKFALFVPASVDAAAYPLMLLAVWALVTGRRALALWLSAGGLFFKEFLAIPLLLAVAGYARDWRRERARRALWLFLGAAALAAAVILLPRLGLQVVASRQEIDPLNNPRSLSRLIANPLNMARNLNIVLGVLAVWLPVLLLATQERARLVLRDLAPLRAVLLPFLALILLLTMYGGTNILTFVSYSFPVIVIALGRLAAAGPAGPRPWEWILALVFTVTYNRVFSAIPLPDHGFDAYIDFYAGWSDRVNHATLRRFAEIGLYAGVMVALRWIPKKPDNAA